MEPKDAVGNAGEKPLEEGEKGCAFLLAGDVFEATKSALTSFVRVFDAVRSSGTAPSTSTCLARLEDNLARFNLWTTNIGAHQPPVDRRSADYRLREAHAASRRIVELLQSIRSLHVELEDIARGDRLDGGDASDLGDLDEDELALLGSDGPNSEAEAICQIVSDNITSLLKVSALLRRATTRDRYAKAAAAARDAPLATEFDTQHVREKFEKLEAAPWLAKRLGDAITQRREYLRYIRTHKDRIAKGYLGRQLDRYRESGDPAATLAPTTTNVSGNPTLTATVASTIQPSLIPIDGLTQRIIEDDDDDDNSQVTSRASFRDRTDDGEQLRVPSLAVMTSEKAPFECPYCMGIVHFRKQKAWERHVFRDLRAYVCTFSDCTAGLFLDREQWFMHELECHRRRWVCQSCTGSKPTYGSESAFRDHLSKQHAGFMNDAKASSRLVQMSSRQVTEVRAEEACALCDDWDILSSHSDHGTTSSSNTEHAVVAVQEIKRHLAGHLEELALFADPPRNDHEDQCGSDEAGSNPQVQEHTFEITSDQWAQASILGDIKSQAIEYWVPDPSRQTATISESDTEGKSTADTIADETLSSSERASSDDEDRVEAKLERHNEEKKAERAQQEADRARRKDVADYGGKKQDEDVSKVVAQSDLLLTKGQREEAMAKELEILDQRERQSADERTAMEYMRFLQKQGEQVGMEFLRFSQVRKEQMDRIEAEQKIEKERTDSAMRDRFRRIGHSEAAIERMVDEEPRPKPPKKAPVYAKVHRDYLAVETLEYYEIPYEFNRNDENYIIILREMDKYEIEALFEHTRRLRAGVLLNEPAKDEEGEEVCVGSVKGSEAE